MARHYSYCPNCSRYVGSNDPGFDCPVCGTKWKGNEVIIDTKIPESTVIYLFSESNGSKKAVAVVDKEEDIDAFHRRFNRMIPEGTTVVTETFVTGICGKTEEAVKDVLLG